VVITGGGVIHDMRADGTLENGVNDVSALNCSEIQGAGDKQRSVGFLARNFLGFERLHLVPRFNEVYEGKPAVIVGVHLADREIAGGG